MQTLLYVFCKYIISLNLHNNSLGVDVCSLFPRKQKMNLESYISCPNLTAGLDS